MLDSCWSLSFVWLYVQGLKSKQVKNFLIWIISLSATSVLVKWAGCRIKVPLYAIRMALKSIPVHGGLDIFTITTMRTYWRTFSTLTLTAKLLKNKLKMADGALKSHKLQNRSNRMKSKVGLVSWTPKIIESMNFGQFSKIQWFLFIRPQC